MSRGRGNCAGVSDKNEQMELKQFATRRRLAGLMFIGFGLCGSFGSGVAAPVGSAAGAAPNALTVPLKSHRAVYKISLVRAEQQEGMRGADGTFTYTLVDRCAGYTIETRMDADFGFSNGLNNAVRQVFAGWEARDGRTASFRMQTFENDMLEDSYRGRAELAADGSGTAAYEGAAPATFSLPVGTMLPIFQTGALLRAAADGERCFSHVVMDGTATDGPYRVSGVIGSLRTGAPAAGDIAATDTTSVPTGFWPVTMAYFQLGAETDTPEYELSIQLQADGIVGRMILDFGTYALSFEPESIGLIEGTGC